METLWYQYLENAGERLGSPSSQSDIRSGYQRDYDRIIFSDAFRRLQNKTQVWPFPKSEEVRNRLTHSLETSSVGRSLGWMVGQKILEKYPVLQEELRLRPDDFGYMVSAAALAHDIGNPPFGHQGEEAIGQFFRENENNPYFKNLTAEEKADFLNFEGNAAGFRILARKDDARSSIEGGLRLSLGTYGAFLKYPKFSLPGFHKPARNSLKKYSVFQSEKDTLEEIADKLKLQTITFENKEFYARFPLAFLTEAADDICYGIIDFEDAVNTGALAFHAYEEHLIPLASMGEKEKNTYNQIIDEKQKAGYLRSLAINHMIRKAVDVFMANEEDILTGTFDRPLLEHTDKQTGEIWKAISRISQKKIYRNPVVLKLEATGKTVIPFLMEKFLDAVFDPKAHKQYYYLLPEKYRQADSAYEKIMQTVMFVAGMTDRQAVEWYRHLNGINLPGYD